MWRYSRLCGGNTLDLYSEDTMFEYGLCGLSPTCHRGRPVSIPHNSLWGYRWTKWYFDRFFPEYFAFSCQLHSTSSSCLQFIPLPTTLFKRGDHKHGFLIACGWRTTTVRIPQLACARNNIQVILRQFVPFVLFILQF
jgi:hypothetical protein